jgi:hypothetical protein
VREMQICVMDLYDGETRALGAGETGGFRAGAGPIIRNHIGDPWSDGIASEAHD